MPLTKTGHKVLSAMMQQYGGKKGKSVFYATMNKHRNKPAYEEPGYYRAHHGRSKK